MTCVRMGWFTSERMPIMECSPDRCVVFAATSVFHGSFSRSIPYVVWNSVPCRVYTCIESLQEKEPFVALLKASKSLDFQTLRNFHTGFPLPTEFPNSISAVCGIPYSIPAECGISMFGFHAVRNLHVNIRN